MNYRYIKEARKTVEDLKINKKTTSPTTYELYITKK